MWTSQLINEASEIYTDVYIYIYIYCYFIDSVLYKGVRIH